MVWLMFLRQWASVDDVAVALRNTNNGEMSQFSRKVGDLSGERADAQTSAKSVPQLRSWANWMDPLSLRKESNIGNI